MPLEPCYRSSAAHAVSCKAGRGDGVLPVDADNSQAGEEIVRAFFLSKGFGNHASSGERRDPMD